MTTVSLSVDSAKLRDVSQKHRVALKFFIYMTFSSVWLFHLHDFFICMAFSFVWDEFLYGVLYEVLYRVLYEILYEVLYGVLYEVLYGFCPWVLPVGFARGFCPWVLPVSCIREFCSRIFIYEFFHLWIFICGFFIRAKYANKVCGRSMRTKQFLMRRSLYEYSFAMRR
jgi:hypothetical protein